MKGYLQTADTLVFPFSGALIGAQSDQNFTLKVGEVFGIDEDGKAHYADKSNTDLVAFFIVAENFDSRKHSAISGFLPGKAAPVILEEATTDVDAGVNLGLSDDEPRLAEHVAGEPILATTYLPTKNGRTQAITKFELTEAPETP